MSDTTAGAAPPSSGYDLLQAELARSPPTFWGGLPAAPNTMTGGLAQGARDVVQGATELPGLVYDSLGNLINLGERGLEGLTGADLAALRIHPAAQNIDTLLTKAGLPPGAAQPNWESKVIRAAAAPLGGFGLGSALGLAPAGVTSLVGSALTGAPVGQVAASTGSALASLYSDATLKDDPTLRSFANAAAGLAAAGSLQGLSNLLDAAVQTTPEIAAWATRARQVYGIPLAGADISQQPMVRTAASVNENIVGSGASQHVEAVKDAMTRAISNTIGADTTRITPEVMSAARQRIGGELDRIGNATTVQADNPFIDDLARIEAEARSVTGTTPGDPMPPQMRAIQNQIDAVQNQAATNNGVIPGQVFQNLIKKGTPLDLVANNPDPIIANYGQQIRDSLFDAWERSAPPDEVQALRNARFQWKNMKTIEPLVEKSPTGQLSPALLTGAAQRSFDDVAYSGAGPLGDLGDIGKLFLRATPDSGTPMRTAIMRLLLNPAAAIPSVGAAIPLNRALGAGLRSDWLANRMLSGGPPLTAPRIVGPAAMSLLQSAPPQSQ